MNGYEIMSVAEAAEYAQTCGAEISERGIRKAAQSGYIPDARKLGRDWLIPYTGFKRYLANRPKRGPRPSVE